MRGERVELAGAVGARADGRVLAHVRGGGRAAAERAHSTPGPLRQVLPQQALGPQAAVAAHARTLCATGAFLTGKCNTHIFR